MLETRLWWGYDYLLGWNVSTWINKFNIDPIVARFTCRTWSSEMLVVFGRQPYRISTSDSGWRVSPSVCSTCSKGITAAPTTKKNDYGKWNTRCQHGQCCIGERVIFDLYIDHETVIFELERRTLEGDDHWSLEVATQRNASMMSRRNVSQITNESRFVSFFSKNLRLVH